MVGHEQWDGQEFDIVSFRKSVHGSDSWRGKVMVWNRGSGSHGRKSANPANGDWKKDDTIRLELRHCEAVEFKRGKF